MDAEDLLSPPAWPEERPGPEPIEITLVLPAVLADYRTEYDEPPASWCRGCLGDIGGDKRAVKLAGLWMHEACARKRLDPAFPREAWLLVAEHIAAAPSRHRVATIRAAMTALAAMLRDGGPAAPAAG